MGWWWLALVWSEVDSHSYQPSEDQARRHQTEQGAFDFFVTGHQLPALGVAAGKASGAVVHHNHSLGMAFVAQGG